MCGHRSILFLRPSGELLQEGDQLEERFGLKAQRRKSERVERIRIGPVRPVARDAEAAVREIAEDQGVLAREASRLEYFESLPAKRMEWVADLSPSQMLIGHQCSSC